jgi:RNA polymerase primary sigma factor
MSSDAWWDNRTYKDYYDDVGKHALLSPSEEFELLTRYRSCPHCKQTIPPFVILRHCPQCGDEIPKNASRIYTCKTCEFKFDLQSVPNHCPTCGSHRDIAAKHRLVEANLRFVVRRAKTLTTNPEYLSRLISAGNVGLMVAVDKFSLDRNTRFLTYADWWIRKEMLDEIRNSNLVHIPTHRQKVFLKEQKFGMYQCKHCNVHTDHPDYEEYLPKCKGKRKQHEFILPLYDSSTMTAPVSVNSQTMVIPDNKESVEVCVMDDRQATLMRDILRGLNIRERDRFIVMGYFNVPEGARKAEEPKSLLQLSAVSGITPERVRQIKEHVLRLFKKELLRNNVTCEA